MDYEHSGNILWGKKWVACGDSFTHGDFTGLDPDEYILKEGIYEGQYQVYPFIIGNRNNMVVINEAINGSTIADPGNVLVDDHVFIRGRYKNIPSDVEYITLKFGINDWHKNIPIGSSDSSDPKEFYGAWNIVLEYLLEHYPYAKIGIIITNGTTSDYTNATRIAARRWGIPYLDLQADDKVSMLHRVYEREGLCEKAFKLRMKNFAVSETNKHPNPAAHKFESTIVESFLRSL